MMDFDFIERLIRALDDSSVDSLAASARFGLPGSTENRDTIVLPAPMRL